jgi:hypothetical protein
LTFSNQCQQIGFEAGTILARMLEQQLNQTPLPGTKVALDTAAGQTMQHRDGLLSQKLFEFVGGHVLLVKRETYRPRVLSFIFLV